jgi:hypothetical protein
MSEKMKSVQSEIEHEEVLLEHIYVERARDCCLITCRAYYDADKKRAGFPIAETQANLDGIARKCKEDSDCAIVEVLKAEAHIAYLKTPAANDVESRIKREHERRIQAADDWAHEELLNTN